MINSGHRSGIVLLTAIFLLGSTAISQQESDEKVHYAGHIDFDEKYPKPTITSIAPFTLFPGEGPRLHIQIQDHRLQYTCTPINEATFDRENLKIGDIVEIRSQSRSLLVRRSPKDHWLKLRLLQKTPLMNL